MLYFLLGLITGLSILGLICYKTNIQLKELSNSLVPADPVVGIGKIAQIRRQVNYLNRNFNYTKLELQLHHQLLDNLPLGYLRINKNNCLVECNIQARELLNIQRWEPNSLRFFLELVRSYELDQLIQQTRKTQKNLVIEWQFFPTDNYILNQENQLIETNESSLFLKAYSYPLPAGEISIFIENQQLIKDLINRRDQAYSDLSHELRTPLTSILLLLETLLKYTDDKTQAWLEKIYQEINRLIDLVQNWLEIYQLEQNPYQTLKFQKLDLQQLIFSAWKSVEILADSEKISFDYQGEKDIMIEADLNRLTQVFVNLFDNSIKYCGQEGVIQVIVQRNKCQPSLVEINVIDSGVGFNPNDLPYIFDRLYRGDKSRTRKPRAGSGLGLSIVKQIIEGHQGSIIARNHPQKGAYFTITLPLQQETSNNRKN
jgi:two-component system phosphate regulon sensor histidine kinase PhoR